MKVLVVGGGGREHALCWAIARSPLCDRLYCAPGNAGIAAEAECVALGAEDLDGLVAFAQEAAVDLVVVGPEGPLVLGLVDRLEAAGIRAFGPTAAAAELEGSKAFAKELCTHYGIPTPAYRRFTEPGPARDYVAERGAPIVVKADGLAAGKGVVVAETVAAAEAAIDAALVEGRFGAAGHAVIVEDFLEGPEVSVFALSDGINLLPLASAHDYKRAFDGDKGPNTGGMGAVSPTPRLTPGMEARIVDEVLAPTVRAMASEGRPYRGVLYAGLMLTPDGPQVLEFNARFGDPECQPLMLRLDSDLLPALVACCDGTLDRIAMRWRPDAAVCVVMAARGYPGTYEKDGTIHGIDAAEADPDVKVFHAGTRRDPGGELTAAGGRVLGVTARGATREDARERTYGAVASIAWETGFCRSDIGQD